MYIFLACASCKEPDLQNEVYLSEYMYLIAGYVHLRFEGLSPLLLYFCVKKN